MYAVCVPDLIYHLVIDGQVSLCRSIHLNAPNKRQRAEDWKLIAEEPGHRVCVLCSKCALLSGDKRSFSERIIYPARVESVPKRRWNL